MTSQGDRDDRYRSMETLAILAAACIVFGLVFKALAFGYAALGLLIIGLFFRGLANRLSAAWLRFAAVLGAVNSKILLALVYYLVLVPVAVVYRWTAGDWLNLHRGVGDQRSYWIVREHRFEARDLERPW